MTTLGSSFISGITTTSFNSTDIVNKDYVDNYPSPLPSQTGNAGKFLTTTDGTSTSWDYVSNFQEFTTTGAQTFNVPSYSNLLHIEAVGAGGGGSAGQTTAQAAVTWTLRTSSIGNNSIYYVAYGNGLYLASGASTSLAVSTDTITWRLRTVAGTFAGGNAIEQIIYGNGVYVVGGNSGKLATSIDTITWITRTAGTTANIYSSFYDAQTSLFFIGTQSSAQILVSTDGITWINRTSGTSGTNINSFLYQDSYFAITASGIRSSTDTIVWTARTSGTTSTLTTISYGNGLYVCGGQSATLITSTNSIVWTLRTTGVTPAQTISSTVYGGNTYVIGSDVGTFTSTNAIVWTLRTSGLRVSYNAIIFVNNTYIAGGAFGANNGVIATSYSQASGAGGGAGSYTSWYIPKAIVSSNLTVNPGVGGTGATTDAATGSAGAGTTISWTGPGGTYTLTASGGSGTAVGAAQLASQSSSFYTTAGGSGASQTPIGSGITATQTNQFQPSGGGSGAGSTTNTGGSSTINVYGISTSASGGDNTGTNGTNAVVISGLPYGYGGGGGGASVSIAATGGNGVRGGGGGGGASIGSTFGNGGNGGDGYVKITWW